jgi:phospholipid-binding lipoprotein MlaA
LVGKPFDDGKVNVALAVVDALTDRVEIDSQLQRIRSESGDPYVAVREVYLAQRRAEIGAICPRHGETSPDPNLIPRVGKGPR